MEDALIPDQAPPYNLGKKGRNNVSYATTEQLEREVHRLDRRIEVVVGASEDRVIGKMAEMESRTIRRMDQRFDEMAALMQGNDRQLDDKIEMLSGSVQALGNKVQVLDGRVQTLDNKVEALDGRVQVIDNKVGTLSGNVKSLEVKVQALGDRMGVLETRMNVLDDKIESVRAELIAEMNEFKQEVLAAIRERPRPAT